ncbi:hypothetical protein BVG80_02275 [Sphingobacteriales bacterium TSM_CSM]|nr:hypothetical protein BVG80_02275 [Sphingobacteriales bacterium TSM_CSM]
MGVKCKLKIKYVFKASNAPFAKRFAHLAFNFFTAKTAIADVTYYPMTMPVINKECFKGSKHRMSPRHPMF